MSLLALELLDSVKNHTISITDYSRLRTFNDRTPVRHLFDLHNALFRVFFAIYRAIAIF